MPKRREDGEMYGTGVAGGAGAVGGAGALAATGSTGLALLIGSALLALGLGITIVRVASRGRRA